MYKYFLFVLCLLVFFSASGRAMDKPSELKAAIHAKQPYGTGALDKGSGKIYDVTLWTDQDIWSMSRPFALTFQYNTTFTAKELADQVITEMRRFGPTSSFHETSYRAQLTQTFHKVSPGDTITALYAPHIGTIFYYNGMKNGGQLDEKLSELFFSIWLGPGTSQPELREQLLPLKER